MERFRTASVIPFGMVLILPHVVWGAAAFADEPLSHVNQIRELPRDEAAKALPVKLTGVVVYSGWDSIVVHDGEASIFVSFRFAQAHGIWKGPIPDLLELEPGAAVEIEGVTDPGGFSPMVLVKSYQRIGMQPIPSPLRPSLETLLSSSLDTQWVEIEGVVRKFENVANAPQYITLLVGGYPCPVIPRNRLDLTAEQLVDARVRVRGVLLTIANLRSQTSGLKLRINGAADIDILVPQPPDPFKAPRVSLDRLIGFRPDADMGHRRVSSGVVTFAVPGRFFYVIDNNASVRVDASTTEVAPGDRVELSGFIDTSRILASFSEAVVRKTGRGEVPPPERPLVSDILEPKTRSRAEMVMEPGHVDFDGRPIRLVGVLRGVLPPDADGTVTLVVESDEYLVRAYLPGPAARWPEGSVVELSGVCELEMARIDRMPWFEITGFHVWLSSPGDLRVISEPPWWTPRRLGFLLAAVAVGLGLTLVWGYQMRRQVRLRGAQLAAEIAAREAATIEFDTILRERRRLASDLHDTLEQSLTGLALQLEIASLSQASDPQKSEHHLTLARQFLKRSRSEAHRTVWDLHAHGQSGRDFLDIVDERVSTMVEGSGIAITLKHEGDLAALPDVPDLIAGNLLLLVQEAVTNAIKHSGASEIHIVFRRSPEHAELVIEDNGRGFDFSCAPSQREGHFGLQGMRERTKRIGGQFELRTAPGHGTTLHVSVPLPSAP